MFYNFKVKCCARRRSREVDRIFEGEDDVSRPKFCQQSIPDNFRHVKPQRNV